MKRIAGFLFLLAALLVFCGCEKATVVPTQPSETEPPVTQVTMVVTAQDLQAFDTLYPALTDADFTGSTCYDAIEQYIDSHPNVNVQYTVSIGADDFQPDIDNLVLSNADFQYPVLLSNLQYLKNIKSIFFRDTYLFPDEIQELRDTYPGIAFDYSVIFCGNELEGSTEELDISSIAPGDAMTDAEKLSKLPNLKDIYLMDGEGKTIYSLEEAAALQKLVPDVLLHYTFELWGKTVSTTDPEIVYQSKSIGNQEGALDTLRTALTVLRGCSRFVLDNCKFQNEDLAQVRDEFRGTTKVVWRIWFGDGGCLTDRDVIYFIYGLYDYNTPNLIYCEDAEFIDFGHNEYLKQCDFVAGMPNLKAIILSGSMVQNLEPFRNCKSLEFLELAFCGYVTDISPLADCTNLKRLNIAFTKVDDLSALDKLSMDVLVDARSKTDSEDWEHFAELHPDCLTQHTGDAAEDQPYAYPWRYEKNGDKNEYYALISEKFNYPHPSNTLW